MAESLGLKSFFKKRIFIFNRGSYRLNAGHLIGLNLTIFLEKSFCSH
jgi:hypothetical protein